MCRDQCQELFLEAFAMSKYFYRINEAKQKYQNLPQLFSRTVIIPLVILFNLQPGKTSA